MAAASWLVLIHQLPQSPAYLRVKIGRHLARLGALGLKNSVYVLPRNEATREDLQWVRAEVVAGGGEASLLEAAFIDGMTDEEIEARFRAMREADYDELAVEARAVDPAPEGLDAAVRRLERRLEEIRAIDFFGASSHEVAAGLVAGLRSRLDMPGGTKGGPMSTLEELRHRTWVTRSSPKIDRIACAWLIRRFIDPEATFKLVGGPRYRPELGELRFDMFEGEFSHEGDLCTFEVLCRRAQLDDPALQAIAEIVHDVDIKDAKYGRPEAAGVASLIEGLVRRHADDMERLERGGELFETLYAALGKARS